MRPPAPAVAVAGAGNASAPVGPPVAAPCEPPARTRHRSGSAPQAPAAHGRARAHPTPADATRDPPTPPVMPVPAVRRGSRSKARRPGGPALSARAAGPACSSRPVPAGTPWRRRGRVRRMPATDASVPRAAAGSAACSAGRTTPPDSGPPRPLRSQAAWLRGGSLRRPRTDRAPGVPARRSPPGFRAGTRRSQPGSHAPSAESRPVSPASRQRRAPPVAGVPLFGRAAPAVPPDSPDRVAASPAAPPDWPRVAAAPARCAAWRCVRGGRSSRAQSRSTSA